jgi:uncharacterized damage-inducible protein DinB
MDEKKEAVKGDLADARNGLFAVLQELRESAWDIPVYSEGETWTVADILRHLTASERDMTLLIERIRQGSGGVPEDFDLKRWNSRSIVKAESKSPADLQAEMYENRTYLLGMIDSIEPKEWDIQGRHASLRIMTVEEILHLIADHERRHTVDIRQATDESKG